MIRRFNLWALFSLLRQALALLLGMGAFLSCADTGATDPSIDELSPRNVQTSKPVHVLVHGNRRFSKNVETDLRFMLVQAAQDDDPALVYHARIDIVVPAPGDSAAHTGRVRSMRRRS